MVIFLLLFFYTATALSAGFVQTDVRESETDGLSRARLRAFVNGRILVPVTLQITIVGGTATGNSISTHESLINTSVVVVHVFLITLHHCVLHRG